jgi:peptide/nickel transport system permease protein
LVVRQHQTGHADVSDQQNYELAAGAAYAAGPPRSVRAILWQRFLKHRLAVGSLIVLILLMLAALAAPLTEAVSGLDANKVDLLGRFAPPSAAHWLGNDELGRDLLLRLLYGGQVSLLVGLAAALCSALIGTALGLLAGYYGGSLDTLLMRFADSVIALPLLPLLIVLAAVDLTKLGLPEAIANSEDVSLYRIVILISIVGWTTVARLVRGATLTMRTREFVRAAEALGAQHADRGAGVDLVEPVARGLARSADLRHRDRLQLPGRRPAGRARSPGDSSVTRSVFAQKGQEASGSPLHPVAAFRLLLDPAGTQS